MRIDVLAHVPVNQLELAHIRLESCEVKANHEYIMQPAALERYIYITEGSVCFFLEGKELWAGPQDMVYLPRDTAYNSRWKEDARFMVVDMLLRNAEGQDIRFGDAPCVLFNDVHRVYGGLLAELAAKAEANGPFDWLERMSLALKLLCEMARDTTRTELDEKYRRIRPGIDYLENNYAEDFSIDDLAKICALSATSFRRLFFECKGMSPVEYRNSLRIRRATDLLKTGRYTVGDAAGQVGIGDINYFGKLFKRYTGLSPGMLRRKGLWADELCR